MISPAKRPPKLPPHKQAGGLAIALTALRPQERQALHRPPILPPLPQSQTPRSPSPALTCRPVTISSSSYPGRRAPGRRSRGRLLTGRCSPLLDCHWLTRPAAAAASLRRSSCCGSCCRSTAPGKPSWLPGKRLSRRREWTWRSARRSSGAKIKKLSGPWHSSGRDSQRSVRPSFLRRPKLRRSKGWPPRSSPRGKVN